MQVTSHTSVIKHAAFAWLALRAHSQMSDIPATNVIYFLVAVRFTTIKSIARQLKNPYVNFNDVVQSVEGS